MSSTDEVSVGASEVTSAFIDAVFVVSIEVLGLSVELVFVLAAAVVIAAFVVLAAVVLLAAAVVFAAVVVLAIVVVVALVAVVLPVVVEGLPKREHLQMTLGFTVVTEQMLELAKLTFFCSKLDTNFSSYDCLLEPNKNFKNNLP